MVGEVAARWGRLDLLINNAGYADLGPIDADDYEQRCSGMLDVLLTAQTRLVRACLSHLRSAPEEVAHATLNFCLPASTYMTGAILPVDGGLLARNA